MRKLSKFVFLRTQDSGLKTQDFSRHRIGHDLRVPLRVYELLTCSG